MPSLIDLTLEGRKVGQHRPWPRVVVDASVWTFAASRTGAWSLEPARPLGRTRNGAYGDHGWTDHGDRGRQPGLPRPHAFLPSASIIRRHCGWNAPSTTCSDYPPRARPTRAPGSITTAGACASHWEIASTRCRRRRPTVSSPPKATACTRSRSARCMRASSSPDISALPPAARPWSGWNSGLDMSIRASTG